MTAISTMTARIAAEVVRADDTDLIAAVPGFIDDAVSELGFRRCVFNEKTASITTISGTGNYSTSTASPGTLPSDVLQFDLIEITVGNRKYELDAVEYSEFMAEYNSIGLQGYPARYTMYGGVLYLYPVPNGAFTLSLSYLQTLTAEQWATSAEQLIRCCTKKNLYLHYLGNIDKASAMGVAEQNALRALRRKAAMQQASGYVTPQD